MAFQMAARRLQGGYYGFSGSRLAVARLLGCCIVIAGDCEGVANGLLWYSRWLQVCRKIVTTVSQVVTMWLL